MWIIWNCNLTPQAKAKIEQRKLWVVVEVKSKDSWQQGQSLDREEYGQFQYWLAPSLNTEIPIK